MSDSPAPGKPPIRLVRRVLRWAEHMLAAFGLAVILYHLCFDVSVMVSGSMAPTLQGKSVDDGDVVLTERITYRLRRPRRWEVVCFGADNGDQLMKRVVGLPGEKVSLEDKELRVNGGPGQRPDSLAGLQYLAYGSLYPGREAACEGGYFVLGDYTRDSQDSRFDGPVAPHRITGRPWLIVWPPSRIGFVNP